MFIVTFDCSLCLYIKLTFFLKKKFVFQLLPIMMKNAVENDSEFDKPLPLNSFKHLGIFFNKDSANKHVSDHLFISHKYCDLFLV